MINLPEHVGESIRDRNIFQRGQKVLVAVSGGLDSMVLLRVLATLSKGWGLELVVGHFNHRLRGRSSDADERFVKRAAEGLGLKFVCDGGDVKGLSKSQTISIEMAARRLRHEFFARAAKQFRCPVIATAHHADDQTELFFLRLLRGAGGGGISGMKWRSPAPFGGALTIVRPLLDLEKSALSDFARREKVSFREDASNRSVDIMRNRVRLELLPLLRRKFNPSVDRSVLRLMEIVGAEAEAVGELVDAHLNAANRLVRRLPVAVERGVIQKQLLNLGLAVDFELVESLRLEPWKRISVSPGVWVEVDDWGRVSRSSPPNKGFSKRSRVIVFRNRAGKTAFGGVGFDWSISSWDGKKVIPRVAGREAFDADKVGKRILLRHWRAGDRFQPIGMKSAVKLQDLFVNQKIPLASRRDLVVAETEHGEIFWVEGLRIGECGKRDAATRSVLVWQWDKR